MSIATTELPPAEPALPASPWHEGLRDLYFRPRRFFSRPANIARPLLAAACATLVGVGNAIGKIDSKLMIAQMSRPGTGTSLVATIADTWAHYWTVVLVLGLVGALIFWGVCGWWYRMRLQWSGAQAPDPALARRVWALQSAVCALPLFVTAIFRAMSFETPSAAANAPLDFTVAVDLIVPFWGCWTSYAAATTAFTLKKSRAVVWFLILPVIYSIVLMGAYGAMAALAAGG